MWIGSMVVGMIVFEDYIESMVHGMMVVEWHNHDKNHHIHWNDMHYRRGCNHSSLVEEVAMVSAHMDMAPFSRIHLSYNMSHHSSFHYLQHSHNHIQNNKNENSYRKEEIKIKNYARVYGFVARLDKKGQDVNGNINMRQMNMSYNGVHGGAKKRSKHDRIHKKRTYQKNKYNRPLVIFSCTNHHGQRCIFCCGLLSDEKRETYVLVLKMFMEIMSNKQPIAMVTDGDLAMREAIKEVLPNAAHRLCV
ncbi:hypothetical protein AHAS_Ahas13G0311800 [Arachis hypogaea]